MNLHPDTIAWAKQAQEAYGDSSLMRVVDEIETARKARRQDSIQDLHLQDDPYLIECARWRAVLADPKPSRMPRVKRRSRWPHWALAIGLGAVLGALLALW